MVASLNIEQKSSRQAVAWERRYGRRLAASDTVVVIAAVAFAHLLWTGYVGRAEDPVGTLAIAIAIGGLWLAALRGYGTRDSRVVGVGAMEYRRVLQATFVVFGGLAIVAYLAESRLAAQFLLLAFPAGLIGLALVRWLWRQWLRSQRIKGEFVSRVLLVGSEQSVAGLAAKLRSQPEAGYAVVGACVPISDRQYVDGTDIEILGDLDSMMPALSSSGADTVAITNSDELTAARTRELSWKLEPGKFHLIVAPSLTDIGGPRIHMRPVAGLPLIHVETPRYEGSKQFSKRLFDIAASSMLILVLSPVIAFIAAAVRLSTPGAIFFLQERVGLNGRKFNMMKFRSMVPNAEALVQSLTANRRQDIGNSVLFKMKDDPRVTPIGRILRRYSLDELPQLFNVLTGSMSLVGPRPSLQREVDLYEHHVRRRFLVKPGITGLWQVSGRSNLTWEESVRLDLYYVENWTLTGDVLILWQTARAVVGKDGAY